jgi:hypothetical protein
LDPISGIRNGKKSVSRIKKLVRPYHLYTYIVSGIAEYGDPDPHLFGGSRETLVCFPNRLLVWCGLSKPLLKDRALEARERGHPFSLNLEPVLRRMRKEEERIR